MKFKTIFKYFIIWQVAILLVSFLSGWAFPLRTSNLISPDQYAKNPLLISRANFDGLHYLGIAMGDYGYGQQAFFPFYPLTIRHANWIFHNPVLTAVVISNLSFLFGLYFLSRLIRLDYSESIVRWTIISLLAFPASFFFGAVYTEGLFFLLLILTFYCGRKGNWWLAGFFGMVACATRFIGIFLFPALILDFFLQPKPKIRFRNFIPLLLIPLGLVYFMGYLRSTTGDPFAFIHVQKLFGQNRSDKIIMIYQVFWRYLKMIATVNRSDRLYLTILLEFGSALIFAYLSVVSFFKFRISYALFNVLAFLTPTFTGTFTSLPRYVLLCFPCFILLGKYLSASLASVKVLYLVINILLFFLFLSLFARGYWVG